MEGLNREAACYFFAWDMPDIRVRLRFASGFGEIGLVRASCVGLVWRL